VVDLVYTKYLKALTSYEGLQRIETFMTPRGAFREVILNAINHKLYESGNPIQISVYEDRIIVFNQGYWPDDIDLEDIYTKKHSSYPHNPNLSKVFFNAGEIEAYGGGFARIRMECERYGAPYPELTITPNGVTVEIRACEQYMKLLKYGRYWETYPEFRSHTISPLLDSDGERITDDQGLPIVAEEITELDASTLASIDRMAETLAEKLNDREKERYDPLFQYLKTHDTINARIATQLTGKSSSTVNRYLKHLASLGVLELVGNARKTAYRRI
jgi:ATP-dependent DNA helicase RecG